jgi:hypothetical protein
MINSGNLLFLSEADIPKQADKPQRLPSSGSLIMSLPLQMLFKSGLEAFRAAKWGTAAASLKVGKEGHVYK